MPFLFLVIICLSNCLSAAHLASPHLGVLQRGDLKITLQELSAHIKDLEHQSHNQNVELEILQEKLSLLEKDLASCLIEARQSGQKLNSSQINMLEARLLQLENEQISIVKDLKKLKQYGEKNGTTLATCQIKIAELEKHLSSDIADLKQSLHSMLVLLQEDESGENYTVKSGDSLGKIASKHKISTETLKKANQLTSDTIFAGQKLKIPAS